MAHRLSKNPEQIKKIMINCPSWIGDAVMSLPTLKAMRQNFPNAKITLISNSWIADLFSNIPYVDNIILYNPKGIDKGIRGFIKTTGKIKQQNFNLALLLQNAFRPSLLTWLAGVPNRWGYATDGRSLLLTKAIKITPYERQCHQIQYYLSLLEKLGLKTNAPDVKIELTTKQKEQGKKQLINNGLELGKQAIGIHPGAAYGQAKRWLPERFAQLADCLIDDAGLQVIVFGAEQELSLVESIISQMSNKPIVLAGKTTLEELMGAMSCCDIFIANDSGPMHVAAALGIPLVAIFGPTDEKRTAPIGKNHVLINKHTACSPCLHRMCPFEHECMVAITADEVYQAVMKKLGIRQS